MGKYQHLCQWTGTSTFTRDMGTSDTSTSGHELALVPEDRQAAHHSHHRARSLSLEKAADWGLKEAVEYQELFSTPL